ncbi:MAG TPA: tryptophan 2,3-dioxygenase [Ilumatobacter sp.]|nr:tryptophan 2,3-dioxygenase [Ilumatobacter sp.]
MIEPGGPGPYDPASEGAEMAFDGRMAYGDYLHLDEILGAQAPLTDAPDELLFIVQHQTSELWMKLCLRELHRAREAIACGRLQPAFKMLSRIARIFEQLNGAWDVLRTMTPSEYTQFRDDLGQSSGFQSYQYREIEFVLGNRNSAMLRPHAHRPDLLERLTAELSRPSLYDEAVRFVGRSGVEIPGDALARDLAAPHVLDERIVAMWRQVYEDPERWWSQYELAEKLVDVEDYFRRWRFNHVTTVERVIGFKRGTGGTGGVSYLKRMLAVELFPDLWRVRTEL